MLLSLPGRCRGVPSQADPWPAGIRTLRLLRGHLACCRLGPLRRRPLRPSLFPARAAAAGDSSVSLFHLERVTVPAQLCRLQTFCYDLRDLNSPSADGYCLPLVRGSGRDVGARLSSPGLARF